MEIQIKYPICSDFFYTINLENYIDLKEWEAMTQEEKNNFISNIANDLFWKVQRDVDGGFAIESAYGYVDENEIDQDF